MDFKIEDGDISSGKNSNNSKLPLIIVIVGSLIVGLLVFLISSLFFREKPVQVDTPKSKPLSLTEENVEILYDYVTYGTRNKRNDKFLKESHVTLQNFTNQEKLYYALQFAQVEDFVSTNKVDENNLNIYKISSTKINNYMKRFFGSQVTYKMDEVLIYPFSFRIGGKNVGILKPSANGDGYDVVFTELQEDYQPELVEPFYSELVAAQKNPDGSYELTEKVVFTEVKKENDIYTISIYKDYQHTDLIEKKMNQTEETLAQNPIKITNYKDKATTIKYLFKISGTMLYFDSSTKTVPGNSNTNTTNNTTSNTTNTTNTTSNNSSTNNTTNNTNNRATDTTNNGNTPSTSNITTMND